MLRQSLVGGILAAAGVAPAASAQSRPTQCPAFYDFEAPYTFEVKKYSESVLVQDFFVDFTYGTGSFSGDFFGYAGQYTFSDITSADGDYALESPYINAHCIQTVASVSGADTVWQALLPPLTDSNGGSVTALYSAEDDPYGAGGSDAYGDGLDDGDAGYCEYDISSDDNGNLYLEEVGCYDWAE